MSGMWMTEEDFENDFWSMAEIPPTSRPPPISETLRAARKNLQTLNSIYLEPEFTGDSSDKEDEDDNDSKRFTCLPSRGRMPKTKLRRPGGKMSDSEFYRQVQLDIRQVSGLGYSNELIERTFKARDDSDDDDEKQTAHRKVQFKPEAQNKSSSSSSSNKGSPVLDEECNDKSLTEENFPPLKKRCGRI